MKKLCAIAFYLALATAGFAGTNTIAKAEKPKPETRTVYMVELDLRNSSFSLSIGKHIRNAMNAFQMEIPVDKDFYDKVHEGEELESHFKTASFFMKGSMSSMKVTVVRKWTKQVPVKAKKGK